MTEHWQLLIDRGPSARFDELSVTEISEVRIT